MRQSATWLIAVFVTLVSTTLATAPEAGAQPAARVARVGTLTPGGSPAPAALDLVRRLWKTHGWVEGENLVVERRYAEGRFERLPALAAELVRLKVDLIVADDNPAIVAARQATTTIPIVMENATDPVGSGLVQSLARPGGNVTGLAWEEGPEQAGKRMGLLKETVPRGSRWALLWRASPGDQRYWEQAQAAGRALGIDLRRFDARGPEDIEPALAAIAAWRPHAFAPAGPWWEARTRILDFAARHRLPGVYLSRRWVEAGALMYYGADPRDAPRRLAVFVDKILRGTRPADLPVELPTKFELVINRASRES